MAAEEMTEYERKRLENIKRNSEMMVSLKIHSHISDLSASSKRLREEKSYKVNSDKKKPKSESPVVIRRSLRTRGMIRRSLRTRGMPPDTSGLPENFNDSSVKPSRSSHMKVSAVPERTPMPLEPLDLDQTYEGVGSHLALIEKLARLASTAQLNSRETTYSNSPTEFARVKPELEEPIGPCSSKLDEDNVVPAVPGRRNTRSATRETCSSESDTEFERVKLEETINPQSLKQSDDCVVPAMPPRRSTRSNTRNTSNSDSYTDIDACLLKLQDNNVVPPVLGATKNEPDRITCNSEFERVKLEDPIDPRSLRLQDDNIAHVMPGWIFTVRFFPTTDMTMVVAGNKYGHLGFWDVKPQNGEEEDVIHLYRPHSAPISGISVHPFALSKVREHSLHLSFCECTQRAALC